MTTCPSCGGEMPMARIQDWVLNTMVAYPGGCTVETLVTVLEDLDYPTVSEAVSGLIEQGRVSKGLRDRLMISFPKGIPERALQIIKEANVQGIRTEDLARRLQMDIPRTIVLTDEMESEGKIWRVPRSLTDGLYWMTML